MAWYRTGTASFTNGSAAVTGAGTTWIGNVAVGEALLGPDGRLYEVASIVSNTSLTLGSTYLGTTASAQPYAIPPTQSYLRDLATGAASLVSTYSASLANLNAGKFGSGSAATPGIVFFGDQDTGLWNKAANTLAISTGGVERIVVDGSGNFGVGRVPTSKLDVAGPIALSVPTAVGVSTYTVLGTDSCVRTSVACTLTLPTPASFVGRKLRVCNTGAAAVISASANVYPQATSTAGTAILAATAGKWCDMQSDGTRWIITASN